MRRLRGAGGVLSVMLALEIFASVSALPDLRSLETRRVPSPVTAIKLNKTLIDLKLSGNTIKALTETLPTEVDKDVEVKSSNDLAKETIFIVNLTQEMKYGWMDEWKERQIAPLQRCDSLIVFQISIPKVEELPARWVAACPRLEHLIVWHAKSLKNLPANLLEGATTLESLDFSNSIIESLPDGFLGGATNLRYLFLNHNRLMTLTSASLMGPALEKLSLYDNQLTNEAMQSLASLATLKSLDIGNNSLSNLCERSGYSMFKNLTELRELVVAGSNVTHLCRDWSEMKFLNHLDFSETQITELDFADVYLSRDPTVHRITYFFYDVNLEKLRFTKDEYELAVRMPPTTQLLFVTDFQSTDNSCRMINPLERRRYKSLRWIPYLYEYCIALDIVET